MEKVLITANFHVYVPQGTNADGTDKPAKRVNYTKGMIVEIVDVPEGQDVSTWIANGLASEA